MLKWPNNENKIGPMRKKVTKATKHLYNIGKKSTKNVNDTGCVGLGGGGIEVNNCQTSNIAVSFNKRYFLRLNLRRIIKFTVSQCAN